MTLFQVYNINSGHNAEILDKSRTLGGYSAFVDKVREYARTFTLEEAMKKAIKYCMDNNILKTFLETHSSEVFNMLLTEWNTEEAKEVWFEDGREEEREEIVRNALAKGFPIETVQEITGVGIEFIKNIQAEQRKA